MDRTSERIALMVSEDESGIEDNLPVDQRQCGHKNRPDNLISGQNSHSKELRTTPRTFFEKDDRDQFETEEMFLPKTKKSKHEHAKERKVVQKDKEVSVCDRMDEHCRETANVKIKSIQGNKKSMSLDSDEEIADSEKDQDSDSSTEEDLVEDDNGKDNHFGSAVAEEGSLVFALILG